MPGHRWNGCIGHFLSMRSSSKYILTSCQTAGRTTKASDVWFSYSRHCTMANGATFLLSAKFDCPVAVLPEVFCLSKCACLWKWFIGTNYLVLDSATMLRRLSYLINGISRPFASRDCTKDNNNKFKKKTHMRTVRFGNRLRKARSRRWISPERDRDVWSSFGNKQIHRVVIDLMQIWGC